jgi:hypothetical protein
MLGFSLSSPEARDRREREKNEEKFKIERWANEVALKNV